MTFIYPSNTLVKAKNLYLILESLNFNYLYFHVYLRIYEMRLAQWFGGVNRILHELSWRILIGTWHCVRNGSRSSLPRLPSLKDNPGIMIKLQKSNVNVQSLFSKYEIHVLNVFTCFYWSFIGLKEKKSINKNATYFIS